MHTLPLTVFRFGGNFLVADPMKGLVVFDRNDEAREYAKRPEFAGVLLPMEIDTAESLHAALVRAAAEHGATCVVWNPRTQEVAGQEIQPIEDVRKAFPISPGAN